MTGAAKSGAALLKRFGNHYRSSLRSYAQGGIVLRRVVQEARPNITKRAKARRVTIHIGLEPDMPFCSVKDDRADFGGHASHKKKRSRFDRNSQNVTPRRRHAICGFFAAPRHKIADPGTQQ